MKKLLCLAMSATFLMQNNALNVYANLNENKIPITIDVNKEINKLLLNYREYLVGNEQMNQLEEVQNKIKAIEKNGEKAISLYLGTKNPNQLFEGSQYDMSPLATINAVLPSSDSFNKTALLIQDIALAYTTYGSKFYNQDSVKTILQDSISSFYNTFSQYMDYNKDGLLFGNWWNWEIGVPIRMSNTLILTKEIIEEKDKDLLPKYVKCFDNYLRNGKNGDVDLAAPQHTGTNLIDITTNRILQGVLINDNKRIEKAVNDMNTVFATIDPYNLINNNTDGVYEDGSFIQHHRVAYTGSYGKLLLQKAVSSLYILNNTPWQPKEQIKTMEKWVYNSFLPVMHEGWMIEPVKGRAISRSTTGYQDSVGVVESMVLLSMYLDGDDAVKMQSQIKYLAENTPLKIEPKNLTLAAISPYVDIIKNKEIKPINNIKKGSYPFNAMDKNVQIGDNFTFTLSRSSNRIAKYEYMSGENLKPWFQGDGAFYLYLNGVDQKNQFGIDYITTIDPNNYPGTTTPNEERKSIMELYKSPHYPLWPSGSIEQNDYVYFPTSTNDFSGSVTLDNMTLAGMSLGDDLAYASKEKLPKDFVVYKNAEANKSWFMTNNKVVSIGSNIYDENNRSLTTTIDNRMHSPNDVIKIYGGTSEKDVTPLKEGTYSNLKWIAYENETTKTKIGYYFPQVKDITIKQPTFTKNQKDIRNVSSQKDNIITKAFTTITYEHKENMPYDSYAYVIVPNATIDEMKQIVEQNNTIIIENSENIHVVEDKENKTKSYNFFEAGKADEIFASSPVSLIVKQENDVYTIAVTDPLFSQNKIEFTIDGNFLPMEKNKSVEVVQDKNKTKIIVDTNKLYGKTITFQLKK